MTAACDGGHWAVVNELLQKGGGLQLADAGADRRSAFALSCFRGHTELVRQLLMAPGYQDTKPNSHWHRFELEEHIYGNSHGVTVGGMLLDRTDRDGNSPLALACRAGHTEVVKLLIWCIYDGGDIQPTRQNDEGGTPIGLAAFHGHLGCVTAMMEQLGKDWKDMGTLGDKFGLRPVQLAAQNEHWEVVRYLEEHGCAWPPEDAEDAAAEAHAARQERAAKQEAGAEHSLEDITDLAPAPEPEAEEAGAPFTVGALKESDRAQWEQLYRGYIAFYERDEPQSFYDRNFARLLEDKSVHVLLARDGKDDSKLLGLAHFIPHPSMSGDVCYLQDLFTDPAARSKGVGTTLINAVVEWCRAKGGIGKVYWNTHEDNPAREKLYDVVGQHKGFVKYQVDV